jgi:hypothetical protein
LFDRFAEALEVGTDQLWEGDKQREIDARKVHESFPEMVERAVGKAGEVAYRLACERGHVSAGELLVGGAALLAAAEFGFAA